MMLHKDRELFVKAIKETSDNLNVRDFYVEKDYWITLVLKRLSESKYVNEVVFKGGTSLSKAYKLIDRFSEDIDIAVINENELTGNQIKSLIRKVEKDITQDVIENVVPGVTRKFSRFRKSVYKYPSIIGNKNIEAVSDSLIIEINSFANPYPYSDVHIQSMIGEYLETKNETGLLEKYNLSSFSLNVLDKTQTLIEKLVSLIRFSFSESPEKSISEKIRHFYDIYYLMNEKSCIAYINSDSFSRDFTKLLEHDKKAFDEPKGWQNKTISQSILTTDFDVLWEKLKPIYKKELSMLAYTEIPHEEKVFKAFKEIIEYIKEQILK